jgi:hypothetical protein
MKSGKWVQEIEEVLMECDDWKEEERNEGGVEGYLPRWLIERIWEIQRR